MPLIQCTKKLLKELPLEPEGTCTVSSLKPLLGNWHANLILIDRRKCVLFTNDFTLFSILVPKLKKPDFKNLKEIFIEHLVKNLTHEGLEKHWIDKILQEYESLQFTSSKSRSVLGTMNDIVRALDFKIPDSGGLDELNILEINHYLNRILHKGENKRYGYAIDRLEERLKQ
jgi:hypothetical protein